MRLFFISFIFLLASCFSPNLGAHVVKGKLYDADTLEPIKDVEVRLKITKPFLQELVRTNKEGDFTIEYSGEAIPLPDLFLEESDLKVAERKIKIDFSHPEFVGDIYEETKECVPVDLSTFDVGSFYLQRKEEFLSKKVASID